MESKKLSRKILREDIRALTALVYAISDIVKVRGQVSKNKLKLVRLQLARCPEYAGSMLGQEVANLMGCTVALLNAAADKYVPEGSAEERAFMQSAAEGKEFAFAVTRGVINQGE